MNLNSTMVTAVTASRGVWSDDEHDRFLDGLRAHPNGPWKAIADFVGTRSVRQVQTHAQKYQERAARWLRDLREYQVRGAVPGPTIDQEMKEICTVLQRNRVPLSPRSAKLQQRSVDRMDQTSIAYVRQCTNAESSVRGPQTLEDDDAPPSFDECIDYLIQTLEPSVGRLERVCTLAYGSVMKWARTLGASRND